MINEKQLAVVAGDSATRALAASAGPAGLRVRAEYESSLAGPGRSDRRGRRTPPVDVMTAETSDPARRRRQRRRRATPAGPASRSAGTCRDGLDRGVADRAVTGRTASARRSRTRLDPDGRGAHAVARLPAPRSKPPRGGSAAPAGAGRQGIAHQARDRRRDRRRDASAPRSRPISCQTGSVGRASTPWLAVAICGRPRRARPGRARRRGWRVPGLAVRHDRGDPATRGRWRPWRSRSPQTRR